MIKKTYVLDTNVYLSDPNSLYKFGSHDIIIPFKVLEEIDNKKTRMDLIGANARSVIRTFDNLRKKGNLYKGVRIEKRKGIIRAQNFDIKCLPQELNLDIPDNSIISVALTEKSKNPNKKVIVVSKDINVRVKCDALNLLSEDYSANKAVDKREKVYTGTKTILVDDQIIDKFYNNEEVLLDKSKNLYPNQFVMLISNSNEKKSALAQYKNEYTPLKKVSNFKNGIWGIKPKNKEQAYALELLMDPEITIVTIIGRAGSGKTLSALAAGLEQTLEKRNSSEEPKYKHVIVSRPIQPMGRDLGYLPGDINEKMRPWIAPISDNLKYLFNNDTKTIEEYSNQGVIEVEALTYIRGRSIADVFLIIDECQNLTTHEVKTIITRLGEGSKIVLVGDTDQIDNSYVNEITNGLTNAVEAFKKEAIAGHVTLTKGERSKTATLATKLL